MRSGGSFGGPPLRQEIGPGNARPIRVVEIRWSGGFGRVQFLRNVPLDGVSAVTEEANGFQRVDVRKLTLSQ